ncbi:MAG: hypothetical protein C0167_02120 [Nitrososphaera sp.]|nr:MAG: hypothetical protein C0167_02120 [Nitrososphaera sp.]
MLFKKKDEGQKYCIITIDPSGVMRTVCDDADKIARFENLVATSKGVCIIEFDRKTGEAYSICEEPKKAAELIRRISLRR